MIEAEAMLRNGQAQTAQELVNRLLSSPGLNPMTKVNPALNDGEAPDMGAFDPVDFTDGGGFVAEDDLPELARARSAGLWLSGQRQGTFRRFVEQDGVNLYPEGTQGDDTSFPVQKQELDNNPNISSACPAG